MSTDDLDEKTGPEAGEGAGGDDHEDELLRKSTREMRFGQLRFAGILVLVCALLMVFSPIFNRYLEAYEAVVVAPPQGGRVEVLTADGMPRSKRVSRAGGEDLEPGTFVRKDHLSWDPRPVPLEELSYQASDDPRDRPRQVLPELYSRYAGSWKGTITAVEHRLLPTVGGRPGEQEVEYRMKLELEDGTEREMEIPESLRPEYLRSLRVSRAVEELETMLVGRTIEKASRSWEPTLSAEDG